MCSRNLLSQLKTSLSAPSNPTKLAFPFPMLVSIFSANITSRPGEFSALIINGVALKWLKFPLIIVDIWLIWSPDLSSTIIIEYFAIIPLNYWWNSFLLSMGKLLVTIACAFDVIYWRFLFVNDRRVWNCQKLRWFSSKKIVKYSEKRKNFQLKTLRAVKMPPGKAIIKTWSAPFTQKAVEYAVIANN